MKDALSDTLSLISRKDMGINTELVGDVSKGTALNIPPIPTSLPPIPPPIGGIPPPPG